MNITKEFVTKKQKNRKTKEFRTVTKEVDRESFFNFFIDLKMPEEDHNDETEDDLFEKLQEEYDIGNEFSEEIVPKAIKYYLGEVKQFDE